MLFLYDCEIVCDRKRVDLDNPTGTIQNTPQKYRDATLSKYHSNQRHIINVLG